MDSCAHDILAIHSISEETVSFASIELMTPGVWKISDAWHQENGGCQ